MWAFPAALAFEVRLIVRLLCGPRLAGLPGEERRRPRPPMLVWPSRVVCSCEVPVALCGERGRAKGHLSPLSVSAMCATSRYLVCVPYVLARLWRHQARAAQSCLCASSSCQKDALFLGVEWRVLR